MKLLPLFIKNEIWLYLILLIIGILHMFIATLSFGIEFYKNKNLTMEISAYLIMYYTQGIVAILLIFMFIKVINIVKKRDYYNLNIQKYILIIMNALLVYFFVYLLKQVIPYEMVIEGSFSLDNNPYFSAIIAVIFGVMSRLLSILRESKSIKEENDLTI